jgi:DNA (cytosine-5)-methyltransferase 1
MTWTAVDLFCGAGGLSAGLKEAGFRIVGAIDSWYPAIQSYRLNFQGHVAHLADIGALDATELTDFGLTRGVDLLAGGPPCQGFSIQRIGSDTDDRNDLICTFARIVCLIRPKLFIMENVPGLLGRRGRGHFDRFISQVQRHGYRTEYAVLDAADFKVAQFRKRVFLVGWSTEAPVDFEFPIPSADQRLTVRDAIGSLDEPPNDHSPIPGDPLHRRTRMSALNMRRLHYIPPGGGFEDLPVELRVNCHKQGAAKIGHRNVYGRLSFDEPASTITARFDSFTRGRFAHPTEHRNITLREGARLQGFPDTHRFVGTQEEMAALIGNAVPPPVAYAIGTAAFDFLERLAGSTGFLTEVMDGELLSA